MKINELEEIILMKSSKLNLKRANDILKNRQLLRINVNKINNSYNVYGNFESANKIQSYSAHLKIDLKKEKITLAKCSCNMFLDLENKNSIYLCEHLIAIGIKFVEEIKKKLNKTLEKKENYRLDKSILGALSGVNKLLLNKEYRLVDDISNNSMEKLEINVSLKEVKDDTINEFEASFFIGNSNMYPILRIEEFIKNLYNLNKYYIGKGLIYDPEKHYFSNEDKKLLEYIYEYILIAKNNDKGNTLRIPNQILKRFLEQISLKKVKFIYNYQTYMCEIKIENLPLFFTLKQQKLDYVLITKKNYPIPLNKKMDVLFFDRKIYIPSEKQIEIYKIFYKHLKEQGSIVFNRDIKIDELNNLISSLNVLSKNVTLDKSIIDKMSDNIEIDFEFKRQEDKFCCWVSLINNNHKIPYNEALNSSNKIIRESKKLKLIESELNKNRFFFRNNIFIFYGIDDEYYEFLKYGLNSLKTIGKINTLNNDKYFKLHTGTLSEAYLDENKNEYFKFSFKFEQFNKADLKEINNAYKNKKTYIKLKDDTFVDLEDNDLIDFIKFMDSLNIDISEEKDEYLIELNKLYYLNDKLSNKGAYLNDVKLKLSERLEKLDKLNEKNVEVPKELNATLREYQVKGYNWLKRLSYLGLGGILGDEMGLGKTIQIITFLLAEKSKHSLVVTPTSLIYNWKQEFERFAPNLKVGIAHGNKSDRTNIISNFNDYEVILTTYGTLKKDYLEYKNIKLDYLIVDEGQNINNYKSQVTQTIKKINSTCRFVLTGTPIENNLLELWSLFDFIMPGYLYTKEQFTSKFIQGDEKSLQNLKNLISPYILRRLKKDLIKELPDKIEHRLLVEMKEPQKKLYKEFIKDIQTQLKYSDKNTNNITLFSYLTRLRQICLDPSIIIDDYCGGSGKIEVAKNIILEKVSEHKILLFSQFTSVLSRFSEELRLDKIEHYYLDGATLSKDRVKLVDEFNKNKNVNVFLISLKAGGTGLNLTSADIVIHFDPWWNPSVEDQATDRAHRIGQKHIVEVIKLIAKDTIEENILLLQEDKKSLINDVITGDLKNDNLINKLKNEEILNLFFNKTI